jgi:hypothetical protein
MQHFAHRAFLAFHEAFGDALNMLIHAHGGPAANRSVNGGPASNKTKMPKKTTKTTV